MDRKSARDRARALAKAIADRKNRNTTQKEEDSSADKVEIPNPDLSGRSQGEVSSPP